MARRSMTVADIKEILVQWDAGDDLSRIARTLGYTRPTVRKYVRAAEEVGLQPGHRRRGEVEWERLARAALAAAATPRRSVPRARRSRSIMPISTSGWARSG